MLFTVRDGAESGRIRHKGVVLDVALGEVERHFMGREGIEDVGCGIVGNTIFGPKTSQASSIVGD